MTSKRATAKTSKFYIYIMFIKKYGLLKVEFPRAVFGFFFVQNYKLNRQKKRKRKAVM